MFFLELDRHDHFELWFNGNENSSKFLYFVFKIIIAKQSMALNVTLLNHFHFTIPFLGGKAQSSHYKPNCGLWILHI